MPEYKGKFKVCLSVLIAIILTSNGLISEVSGASYFFNTSMESDTSIVISEIIRFSSIMLEVQTNEAVTCKYSTSKGKSYSGKEGIFDFNFETLHKKTLTGLTDGIYKYYIQCKNSSGFETKEMEGIFSVNIPVSGQIVFPNSEVNNIGSGKIEVKLITSKILSQTPSLSYSFDGISYNPIPVFGSGTQWTGYLLISSSGGEKVGSFKFQGRDLDGNTGTEITSGGIFIVDTIKPKTITDIKAEGYNGRIELKWHSEDSEEINKFNIYRSTSPQVDYSDFYKSSEGDTESFSDTSVEKGKTYYYRISGTDNAGNIADLSTEVYATVLLENITLSPSGLEAHIQ